MALVDVPAEMILRMLQLQAGEGFGLLCGRYPDGVHRDELHLRTGELVYGSFKDAYFFTNERVIATSPDLTSIAWTEIASAVEVYRRRKDFLIIGDRTGALIEIDITSPARTRSATRITQMVEGLAKRWSEAVTRGPPFMSIEAFFASARNDDDFAVNTFPHPTLGALREAFEAVRHMPGVVDLKIVIGDPEDDGPVYGEAVALATTASAADPLPRLAGVGAQEIVPADENTRRKLGADPATSVWLVCWP